MCERMPVAPSAPSVSRATVAGAAAATIVVEPGTTAMLHGTIKPHQHQGSGSSSAEPCSSSDAIESHHHPPHLITQLILQRLLTLTPYRGRSTGSTDIQYRYHVWSGDPAPGRKSLSHNKVSDPDHGAGLLKFWSLHYGGGNQYHQDKWDSIWT